MKKLRLTFDRQSNMLAAERIARIIGVVVVGVIGFGVVGVMLMPLGVNVLMDISSADIPSQEAFDRAGMRETAAKAEDATVEINRAIRELAGGRSVARASGSIFACYPEIQESGFVEVNSVGKSCTLTKVAFFAESSDVSESQKRMSELLASYGDETYRDFSISYEVAGTGTKQADESALGILSGIIESHTPDKFADHGLKAQTISDNTSKIADALTEELAGRQGSVVIVSVEKTVSRYQFDSN